MKAIQTKKSVIEDIKMALAFFYDMECDIDILLPEFQDFLHEVETFLQIQTIKYVWRYWCSISRYILSLNHKSNTYWI